MSEKLLDLGQGLELHRAEINELIEQDVNARSMPKQMFDRLKRTVGRDQRLESLPFCAKTARGIEIVSGHHRSRSAKAAELTHIYILLDTTGLTGDQIKGKQLAHNALEGEDNQQLLAKIYEQIQDVDSRLESFIDPKDLNINVPKVAIPNVDVGVSFRTALIVFLPYQEEQFHKTIEAVLPTLPPDLNELYLAELQTIERFKALLSRAGKAYNVRAIGTILEQISRIVLDALGEDSDEPEVVSLFDLFGRSAIPAESAKQIASHLERLVKQGQVTKKERWKALEMMVLRNGE